MSNKKSNLLCQTAAILLNLSAIVIITYIAITYITVRKYEEKLAIKVNGNEIISLYNIVGIRKIESVENHYNANIIITYKYVTTVDIENYVNSLVAEKYIILNNTINNTVLGKKLDNGSIIISISNYDDLYEIVYYAE